MDIVMIALSIAVFFATAVFWEFVAFFMHKYVMHGIGWYFHEDHHISSGRKLQRNDFYTLLFALISFLAIFLGLNYKLILLASFGFGVALYGTGYFLFHDIMFHRRIKAIKFKPKNPYLVRIINAHRIHHGTVTKLHAKSFGFLYTPKNYNP